MTETGGAVLFFLFAGLSIFGAVGVVAFRNPVRSALSLALVFICLSVLYVMLDAPFIAVAQVMIYAGAIMILFLFVIMVLNPRLELGPGPLRGQRTAAVVLAAALVAEVGFILTGGRLAPGLGPFTPELLAQVGHTQAIGALLFTNFMLPFEITSLLLLVAIIGVISLAKRA